MERETSGKVSAQWTIESLISCERKSATNVLLTFDTIRRDKENREYMLEPSDAYVSMSCDKISTKFWNRTFIGTSPSAEFCARGTLPWWNEPGGFQVYEVLSSFFQWDIRWMIWFLILITEVLIFYFSLHQRFEQQSESLPELQQCRGRPRGCAKQVGLRAETACDSRGAKTNSPETKWAQSIIPADF